MRFCDKYSMTDEYEATLQDLFDLTKITRAEVQLYSAINSAEAPAQKRARPENLYKDFMIDRINIILLLPQLYDTAQELVARR